MKYMSGPTVSPTVTATRGFPVIFMQQSATIGNAVMLNVLYQGANATTSDERDRSSECPSPHAALESACNTPPPILDKYGTDDISNRIAVKPELPDVDSDMDTIAILSVQVDNTNGNCNEQQQKQHSTHKLKPQHQSQQQKSSTSLKDNTSCKEVRRSQRKAGQAPRRDDPFDPKGSNSNDGSTDDASTSYLTAKKIKSEETGRTREGNEYQATVIPTEEWMEPPESYRNEEIDRDVCVWRDDHNRIESKELEEFCQVTRQQFGFDVANSLEVIYYNNYDMTLAMERVEEMIPPKEEPLNAAEQRLFIKSINVHGKNFFRMQKMIPTRSVSSLVNHYYSTKKARCFGVISDEPCPLMLKVCDDENPVISRRECDNCAPSNVRAQKRKKGRYCAICDLYFRRMKRPRPYTVPLKQSVDDDEGVVAVDGMGSPPPITGLKTACQKSSSHDCSFTSSHYAKIRQQNLSQWTIDEELEALKGFHRFGKNFKAISELVKTKTPEMIRRFYEDKQSTFRIEYLINTHNKSVRSEERLSDSESTAAVCKGIVKDTGNGCENPAVRRSQRTVLLEPVVTRMTTRHAPSATSVPISATNYEEANMPSLT